MTADEGGDSQPDPTLLFLQFKCHEEIESSCMKGVLLQDLWPLIRDNGINAYRSRHPFRD